jgi:carbonic anhydrase
MSDVLKEVLAANAAYAENFGDKSKLKMPPARQFAILTCMDARLDPAKYAGLSEGDAHVIRNAGGRVNDDSIRSLVISGKILGTREWFVIHHTECGAALVTEDMLSGDSAAAQKAAAAKDSGYSKASGDLTGTDQDRQADLSAENTKVIEDVRLLRNHPLVAPDITIYGFIYDVRGGRLIEVPEATTLGKAQAQTA